MTTQKIPHRPLVAPMLPQAASALVVYAGYVVTKMTGNPSFPSPNPPLATVSQAIDDLQVAQTASLSRTRGTITVRDEKKRTLVVLMQRLAATVQAAADDQPDQATSIIESAGLAVRSVHTPTTRSFRALRGPVSGAVTLLAAAAADRASYEWQLSIDGGHTWVLLPVTLRAKTTVTGLTPGSTATFRYRPVTKAGEGEWSQEVSIVVV